MTGSCSTFTTLQSKTEHQFDFELRRESGGCGWTQGGKFQVEMFGGCGIGIMADLG